MFSPDWRSAVGFSDRLTAVVKISSACRTLDPAVTPLDARRESTALENEAFGGAQSLVEYHSRCAEIVQELLSKANHGPSAEDSGSIEQCLSPVGIEIGKYKNATHYQDGLFSAVYKATSPDDGNISSVHGKLVALKVTEPSAMTPPHDSIREAYILREARSSHVIPLLETFQQPGGRLVLVCPFLPYDFDQALHKQMLTKEHTRTCLRDLFSALAHIHSKGIIHRDVKPSNILLSSLSGPAYLADFGIAWQHEAPASEPADMKITDVGTTCYRPPELLFGNCKYGTSLDIWAAGCTVAEALNSDHETLFDAGDLGSELALIQSIFKKLGTPTLEIWPEAEQFHDWGKMQFYGYEPRPWSELVSGASDTELDLVSNLVIYESGSRMTAEQALQHPYFLA